MRSVVLAASTILSAAACLATSACVSPQSAPPQEPRIVRTGARVLADDGFSLLLGKRVGAIVNQTAVVGDSVHLVDAMLEAGVDVVALFGPEHGIRGNVGDGVAISDGRDAATGLPVFSLYGPTRKPDPALVADLDLLLFDVQDVGARFYTFISTMGLAMQSAADAGIGFVVLDRPNPLGGEYVSGFVLEPGFESFVGQYPIPVAHGMTVGELARAIVGEGWLDGLASLDLTVVEMDGWKRDMRWPDTGLDWIPTSPNIPDFETASVYPGMCFLEGLTLSEGRGTPRPFLQFGGPTLDAQALADDLASREIPGVEFSVVAFTPRPDPVAAPSPKHNGTVVHGASMRVTDDSRLDPLRLGVEVLAAIVDQVREKPGSAEAVDELFRGRGMDRLAGTAALRDGILAGKSADEITASWETGIAAFRATRAPYLIYD